MKPISWTSSGNPPVSLARSGGVKAREYRMARSDALGMAVFAVILIALGVFEIVGDAMGRANRGAWWYFQGAGLIVGGWFAARSLRRVTWWADDAGLRLRGSVLA
jgi:hypothetical protein